MTNHTPTKGPWRVDDDLMNILAEGVAAPIAMTICAAVGIDESQANAAFIVKARNVHDELVEACEAALFALKFNESNGPADQQVIGSLTAAITKAQEESHD